MTTRRGNGDSAHMQNVILVHGAWHGSWCWSLVTKQLAARRIPSVAVDLDGHGLKSRSPVSRWSRPFDPAAYATEPADAAGITVTSTATSLVGQIKMIGGGEPCVVVAHSMGGIIASAAAELAPELFAHLIYVSAFAPASGQPAEAYFTAPEAQGGMLPALLAADPAVVGALRIDPGDPGRHAVIRQTFYGDVDEVTAAAAVGLLTPDASTGVSKEAFPVTTGRYGTIPHTYVVCTGTTRTRSPCSGYSSRRSTPCRASRRQSSNSTARTRRSCRSRPPSRPRSLPPVN